MPRKPRLDIPGLLQHVIVRGIEKCKIFLDDYDRRRFIDRFSSLLVETGTECFAWSLMPNHFHLLLRCNKIELSRFMRRLLTGHAVTFNHRHDRSGHLFQNRYKSIICEEDTYFLELVRYIHLNPLRAGMVLELDVLDSYPWSGHAGLMGKQKLSGQAVDEVLLQFGNNLSDAGWKYRQFIAEGVSQGRRPELVGGGLRRSQKIAGIEEEIASHDYRVLGSSRFVDKLRLQEGFQSIVIPRFTLPEIQKIVSGLFKVDPKAILWRTRKNSPSEARAVFCFVAARMLGVSATEVGKFLSMGPSSVSRAVRRGELILQDSSVVKKGLDRALKQ